MKIEVQRESIAGIWQAPLEVPDMAAAVKAVRHYFRASEMKRLRIDGVTVWQGKRVPDWFGEDGIPEQ